MEIKTKFNIGDYVKKNAAKGKIDGITICIGEKNKSIVYSLVTDNERCVIVDEEELVLCQDILDKAEKRYLENALRPFRNNIKCIFKSQMYGTDKEFLGIYLIGDQISFPFFKKGTMYKDMEEGKHYTLEELGLFGGE